VNNDLSDPIVCSGPSGSSDLSDPSYSKKMW